MSDKREWNDMTPIGQIRLMIAGDVGHLGLMADEILALCDEVEALRELRDAVEQSDGAHHHYPPCDLMHEIKGCRCGHDDVRAALAKAKEATSG